MAERLRAAGPPLLEPRAFTADQVVAWIAADEADARELGELP